MLLITQQLWPASLTLRDISFYGNTAFYIKLSETDCVRWKTVSDWIVAAVSSKKYQKYNTHEESICSAKFTHQRTTLSEL